MPDLVKLGLWDKEKNRIKDNAKQVVQENRQAIRESNVRTQASRGGEAAKRIGQAGIGSSSKLNLSSAKPATSARSETKTTDSDDLTGKSGRFFLARIGEIAQTNPDEGEKLYNMYQNERSNPSSPLYDIYANATSSNAKYNAQTEKAMGEWQALQQELSYWAQSDRNYSDDEIIGRINWKNYPTLSKMNNTKNGGQTVYLTQPIGYNEDAMYGVLWAARNPELSTGDYSMDAVLSAMGRGKEYQRDDTKAARLDPTSTSYNPYLVGSTMDSEIQHFGVNGFDADWLNNNLQYRGTDEYASVYKAEQTTSKAEKELADLQAELEADLASGLTLDEAFSDELLDDYPTLRSMQQGLDKGSPVSITRPVAYDLPSLKSAYDQSYQQLFGTESNADYAASVAESTGAQPQNNTARDKVTGAAALTQRQYFSAIWQTGTNDEKKSMSSSGSVDYAPSVADIQSSIQQGTGGKQGAMSSKQLAVSQQTSTPFFEAMDARTASPEYSDELAKVIEKAGIDPSAEDFTNQVGQKLGQMAAEGDSEAQLMLNDWNNGLVEEYWEIQDMAETNTAVDEQLAAIDQQWKDAFGDDTPEYRAHKYAMETIYSFKDAPKPDWNAYDVVGYAAQQEGATEEDTTRTALSALAINNQQIAYLKTLMEQSEQYGVPEEYLANMQATVENLEKSNRLIASYSLKNSGDYAQGVAAFDELTFDTSPDAYNSGRGSAENVIRAISNPESIQDYDNSPNRVGGPLLMSLAQADPDVAYTELMTDAERNNFKYLYATQGEESAMAYFSDLRSQLSARYAQEESEQYQQFGEKLPVTASVSSILASPAQLQGFMYTIGQAIAGEQADPNSPWFSSNRFVSGTRQGTKDAFADAVGDNETAKNIFNFFYDALMSSGDSLVSAGMGGATGLANAGLAIMSAEAASNAMQEALYKGADSKTAAFAGLAAGAAEAITEKIPFDKLTELYHAGSTGGKVLKLIADNVIGEGVGEGASEYLGALGDYLVMGDDSDFVQSVEQYKADGMTEDEAVRQAANDLTRQALMAALAGTVSGMASSGVGYAAGKLSGSNADVQQNQQEQQQNQQQENQQENQQTGEQANQQEQQAQQTEAAPAAVEPENVTSDNAVNVLYKAQQNGVGQMQQTASVDAALRSFGVEDATATAAAKNVIASDSLAKVTKVMENAQDRGKAAQAIAMAMLNPDSESAATLADMGDTITAEDVVGLMQMYDLDMQDDAVLQAFGAAVENSQVADETVAALGQMDSSSVKGAQNSLKKAKQAEKTFRENLAKESANVNAADQALDSARQARIQNTNPDTIAAEKKALQNRSKAMEKWNDARQKHLEAKQAVADARTELQDVQEAAVNQARTEALGKQQERQAAAQEAQNQQEQQSEDSFIQMTPEHTPEQKAEIQSYYDAVDARILEAAQQYKENPSAKDKRVLLSETNAREVADIQSILGVDVEGYTHTVNRNFFNHVEKRHGLNGEADQTMKSVRDVARVGWVLDNYDSVEPLLNSDGSLRKTEAYRDANDNPIPMVKYTKQLDGTVYVVEAVGDNSWKRLWLVSAYMQKNTPASSSQGTTVTQAPYAENQPLGNVRNAVTSPVTDSIAQDGENMQGKSSRGIEKSDIKQLAENPNQRTVQTNNATGVSASKKVKSPVDTTKQLAKALNVGQDIGSRKVPRGVQGFYNDRAKYIAVRSTEAGNISTTMHEIGHALADKLGMTGTQAMVNNLDPVFAQNYSAEELPGEAFAEFMWRYMTDDAAAQDFAGDAFLYDFEKTLRQNGLEKQVHKARDEMHAYVNATVNERIGAVVKNRSEKTSKSLKDIRTKITDMLVDSTAVLEDVNNVIREQTGNNDVAMGENLRNSAILRNTASRRAYNMLVGNLTDSNWQVIGDGLAARFEKAGITGKDFDALNNYMLALHSLDRDAAGKRVFDSSMTKEQREAFIQDIQQYHPEIARAEQEFQQFRNEFMQAFMVDTGFMTQETLDLFNRLYPHYVPTFRVKEGKSSKSGVGNKNFTIRTAKGSTENIYNPIDSFVQMVDSVVNMVSQNNTALVWDDVYHRYEGLGLYGREVTQDVKADSVDTTALQNKIAKILEEADADTDVMQQVIDAIGPTQVQWKGTGGVALPNVLTVQKADGSKAYYEIFDTELFKALSGYKETAGQTWQFIGNVTKAMSALTTGSNPVFAVRNFMRDFQKSVTYGSWASNYGTGAAKWLRAAWEVWRETGEYEDYKALGGGGWTRIETGTKKGADAYRADLFKGYNTSNAGRTAKWAGQKVWNAITLARLNEVVEQTSRYAEYRFGKQERTTAEGKQQAFLKAQEATVDFSRSGYSNIASDLKQVIPFLGASTQGVYQTGREFTTKAERSRLPARFAKTVINTALTSALVNLLVFKHTDDDDKEEYRWLSEELKADNFFIPNFAPAVFGDAPYLRIPIGQDPLMRMVHGAVSNAIWNGTGEEPLISLTAIAKNVLDGFNPVNGTIFDAAIAMGTNTNWYGSKIVPTRMESWDPSTQYTEETPDIFVTVGRLLNVSPMKLQYLAEQYTGFLGQMVIPAISKDANTGELGGFKAAINAVRKRLTSDPLKSNDITSSFYDGLSVLQQVGYAAKNDRPLNMLRHGLTEDEARAAVDEANELTGSNGVLTQAKKYLNDGYAQIEEIEARTDLSDHEKYILTSEVRRDMMLNTLEAQEAIGAYRAKYIDGENPLYQMMEGVYGRSSNAYEKLPEIYQTDYDAGASYMQRAKEVWEVNGNDAALPHVSYSFSDKKIKYEVPEEDQEQFNATYKKEYQLYVNKAANDAQWERLSDEEKLEVLKKAHSAAQKAAKDEWLSLQK